MKRTTILSLLLCSYILSYNISCDNFFSKKNQADVDSPIYYGTNGIKDFYIPYGEDSLLMIPDFGLAGIYGSDLETFRESYVSYEVFEYAFLNSKKLLPQRLNWSYHIKLNKTILNDYYSMFSEDFLRKYLYVKDSDTLSFVNDTTLAYCLDKYGFFSMFDYLNSGKIKVVKSEYPYWYSRLIEIQVNQRDCFD